MSAATIARVLSAATSSRERLHRAVATLYDVFASWPLRGTTSPCLHCGHDEAPLHARPLRQLTIGDLDEYARSAMMTWGDEEDFKHFLPRIFEILTTADFPSTCIEVVYRHLALANLDTWAAREQAAVMDYLHAKWHVTIGEFPSLHTPEAVLCAIAPAVADLRPFLEQWRLAEGDAPVRQLAEFLWNGGVLTDAFWSSDQRAQQQQIHAWLASDAVHDWLEAAFFAATSSEAETKLSYAVTVLESLRT